MDPDPWPSTPSSSATSRSSPTSTTARARWPTSSCSRPGRSPSASSATRSSTTWTWSASAASPSRPAPSRSTTRSTARTYELNLIDTPGHVDFHYEVSRSLAACEGAILLVDATQGVQAQTVANAYLAIDGDLAIVPVLNKIDLPAARPDEVTRGDRARPSASTRARSWPSAARPGMGVAELFRAIIERVPPPAGRPDAPLRALIFDRNFDDYQGVVVYVRVIDGTLRDGQKIRLMARRDRARGHRAWASSGPARSPCDELGAGQVGYFIANIKGSPTSTSATPSPTRPPRRRGPARLQGAEARWSSAASSRPRNNEFEDLRDGAPEARAQRLQLHLRARRPPTPSASASAAASWACSTWRSSSSGSSARATSTLVQTAPNVTYEIVTTQGRDAAHRQPDPHPRRRRDRGVPRAVRPRQLHPPRRARSAPSCSSARTAAGPT